MCFMLIRSSPCLTLVRLDGGCYARSVISTSELIFLSCRSTAATRSPTTTHCRHSINAACHADSRPWLLTLGHTPLILRRTILRHSRERQRSILIRSVPLLISTCATASPGL